MVGKIDVNAQCIHAAAGEPLSEHHPGNSSKEYSAASLVGGGSKNDGVGHCSRSFEGGDYPGNAGLLLTNSDVYAIQRAIVFVASLFRRLVEARLADNGVNTDCCFTS